MDFSINESTVIMKNDVGSVFIVPVGDHCTIHVPHSMKLMLQWSLDSCACILMSMQ